MFKRLTTIIFGIFWVQLTQADIQQASPATFQSLAQHDNVIVLDVRTPQEIAAGKISGASELNLYDADFKRKLSFLQKDKTILVYCRSGGRSSEAASMLESIGHENVVNLVGGITAWNAKNLPTVIPAGRAKKAPAEPIDTDVFKNQLLQEKVVLLDFHTEWCTPCKKMAPVVDQLEKDNQLPVIRIDLDANQSLAESYAVEAVPTFILIKDGNEVWRTSGIVAQEVIESQL